MNDYMLAQLQMLETFIEEAGRGETSAQAARQALGVLRDEIDRMADLRAALNIVEQEIIEPISLDTSALLPYVTQIPMKSKGVYLQSFQGKQLNLLARPPKRANIDEMILFGSGVDEPLGIVPAPVTITVDKDSSNLSINDLVCMLECLSPTAHAMWIVNSRTVPLLASLRDFNGHKPFAEEPASMFGFPVVLVDSQMCEGQGFEVALADLRYYVWGEHETDDGLLVDGTPGVSEPFYGRDGMGCSGPFVVLGRGD